MPTTVIGGWYHFNTEVVVDMPVVPARSYITFRTEVKGLRPGPGVVVSKTVRDPGLYVVHARCWAADWLEIVMVNPTGQPIDPPDRRFFVTQVAPGADGETNVVI